jgi:carbonic anhydrase
MTAIRPLPAYLAQRFHGWKATSHRENHAWYRRLAETGQRPREMIIACCDSRVHVASMFGGDSDEIFIHRTIAALVPALGPDGRHQATSAAVEYAVGSLGVSHVIVLGHAGCGGVRACHDMCAGRAPPLDAPDSLLGRWLDILRPACEALPRDLDAAEAVRRLEHEAVRLSLENLMGFPAVRAAVAAEALSLHGLWTDVAAGALEVYDAASGRFLPV